MKRRGGRFGKYGEVKRKTRLRQARLSHLERTQPGLPSERRGSGKREKPREER
ncbi:MAG TPA: hypothetical protein VEI04_01220 [Syntrophobacteria bacterium]|nr:hypothetical protein [Syntrophobacteria bacterium]